MCQAKWVLINFMLKMGVKRKAYGRQVCEEGLLELLHQPYHRRLQVKGDAAGATMRRVHSHAPVNYMVFFLCHGFIKVMYINKILMKTRLRYFLYYVLQCDFIFLYYVLQCELLCVPTSGSGFYQWVQILPVGLDFASGSGYEDTIGQTPCCIM